MADVGLLLHGILFFTVLAAYVHCRQAGQDFWRLADLLAPGLLLVYALGLLGTIFGPAAFRAAPLPDGNLFANMWNVAALYESFWNLAVAAIFFRRKKQPETAGGLFLQSLIWHGAGLFTAEWLRPEALLWGHFRVRQFMAFAITHLALILLWWRKKQSRPPA